MQHMIVGFWTSVVLVCLFDIAHHDLRDAQGMCVNVQMCGKLRGTYLLPRISLE